MRAMLEIVPWIHSEADTEVHINYIFDTTKLEETKEVRHEGIHNI